MNRWTVLREATTTQVYRVNAPSKREAIEAWMRGDGNLVDTLYGKWNVVAIGKTPAEIRQFHAEVNE